MRRPKTKTLIKILLILLLIMLFSVLVYVLTRSYPAFITKYYSDGLYQVITFPAKWLPSILPFSLGEILLTILLILMAVYFFYSLGKVIRGLIKKTRRPYIPMLRFFCVLLSEVALAVSLFVWMGGLNYNGLTYAEKNNIQLQERSAQEVYDMLLALIEKANAVRRTLPEKEDGSVADSRSFQSLSETALNGFQKISESHNLPEGYYVKAKPALFSYFMCYTNITGIFPYIVPEPIVNAMTPTASLPATICHEMAHQRAVAREDEANYIAYLACINNEDPLFQYSGYHLAIVYTLNALYGSDYALWADAYTHLDEGIVQDFKTSNAFWAQFETPVADISDAVNDTYLQANNIEDGVQSYGRLVDLLLAEYYASKA